MSSHPEKTPRPTLEELLRLKRAERPDSEFWQEFDRGLRHKQLAAIVEPRPWWLGLNLLFRRVPAGAWSVPVGAAAALIAAFSLSPVRFAASGAGARVERPEAVANLASPADLADSIPAEPSPASDFGRSANDSADDKRPPTELSTTLLAADVSPKPETDAPAPVAAPAPETPVAATPLPASAVNDSAVLLASIDGVLTDGFPGPVAVGPETPVAPGTEFPFTLLPHLPASAISAASAGPAPGPVDLADENPAREIEAIVIDAEQLTNPRHARLLTAAWVNEESEKSLVRARERVVHSLADGEELYASVTRLGVRGDRLSVSF